MVDPNTRQGKRTPVTLKIKFKSETLEQFIERYAVDVSQGGIFIRTKEPLAVGTQMRFEFQLRDASPLIAGEGTVVWTRENDPSRPAIAPGMGVRFDRLAEGSQTVLERILSEKAKQAPVRTSETTTKPPLFTDTPTKVAPLPVAELLSEKPRRPGGEGFNDQHTPLPKPMPFHSDAEDFDEQAFEEATKVRALDELIAQTAESGDEPGTNTAIIPPDELAARRLAAGARMDSTLADPPSTAPPSAGPIGVAKAAAPDRDSAPGLPSPPSPGPAPRMLDTTPSPRSVEVPAPELGKTKLGFDAPRAGHPSSPPANKMKPPTPSSSPAIRDAVTRPSGQQAVPAMIPATSSSPARRPMAPAQKSSTAPMVILILLLLAAGGGALWFFYIRPKQQEANQPTPGSNVVIKTPGSGSAPTPGSGTGAGKVADIGSGGSAEVKVGSGSNNVEPPKGPVVDTVIASSVEKATIEIVGTDQKGASPFTAKLEKDREYKVRVSAIGFVTHEIDVKGGAANTKATLVAKPKVVSIATEPAGALIFVDGAATGHTTPHDVELTKAQASKKSVKILMRKSGYKPMERVVATDAFEESDSQMLAKLDERLSVQIIRQPPPPPPDKGSGSSGSAQTGTGSSGGGNTPPDGSNTSPPPPSPPPAGSAATKPPTPTPPPAGSGSAAKPPTPTPPPAGSAAVKPPAEPEPDFVKK